MVNYAMVILLFAMVKNTGLPEAVGFSAFECLCVHGYELKNGTCVQHIEVLQHQFRHTTGARPVSLLPCDSVPPVSRCYCCCYCESITSLRTQPVTTFSVSSYASLPRVCSLHKLGCTRASHASILHLMLASCIVFTFTDAFVNESALL